MISCFIIHQSTFSQWLNNIKKTSTSFRSNVNCLNFRAKINKNMSLALLTQKSDHFRMIFKYCCDVLLVNVSVFSATILVTFAQPFSYLFCTLFAFFKEQIRDDNEQVEMTNIELH